MAERDVSAGRDALGPPLAGRHVDAREVHVDEAEAEPALG